MISLDIDNDNNHDDNDEDHIITIKNPLVDDNNIISKEICNDKYTVEIYQTEDEKNCVICLEIYDNKKNLVFTKKLNPGEMLIINDANMYHDVTPITLEKQDKIGYRDLFVFTTIS